MQLKLDAPAVRALIEADDQFKLELSRAVVAEIVRKTFLNDADAFAKMLTPDALAKVVEDATFVDNFADAVNRRVTAKVERKNGGGYGQRPKHQLTKDAEDKLNEAVGTFINEQDSAIRQRVKDRISRAVKHIEGPLMDHFDLQIRHMVHRTLGRQIQAVVNSRVKEAVDAALAGVLEPLEEAETVLDMDDLMQEGLDASKEG